MHVADDCLSQVVVDSDVERLQLMKQEKEILERQSRRAGGGQVSNGGDGRHRYTVNVLVNEQNKLKN